MHPFRRPTTILIVAGLALANACVGSYASPERGERLRVIQTYPHDAEAYTQGFLYRDGIFFESTGQYGASSVRKVEIATGKIIARVDLPDVYFAEGLTALGDRLYQLTWKEETGFVYGVENLEPLETFSYGGEGWGLTTDGTHLIVSDGTYRLKFLHPESFEVVRMIEIQDQGRVVFALNELEWVRGEIWANIWQRDEIARIDPNTGNVIGWISTRGLLSTFERWRGAEVANGIAYDSLTNRLWLTGKYWPRVFEVETPW